jgi:hypothetical protein
MEGTTSALLSHVESLGYVAKVFRVNDTVEMHAVPLRGDEPPQIARCNDGDGGLEAYRAACLLADAVRIELDDG